jgi:hypothetical protein
VTCVLLHVVFDLCEEPHPRVNVPPGTVCDYNTGAGPVVQVTATRVL